jgi:hypothetical protein
MSGRYTRLLPCERCDLLDSRVHPTATDCIIALREALQHEQLAHEITRRALYHARRELAQRKED